MLGGEAPRSSSLGGGLGCRTVGLAVSGWPREGGQAGSTWPFRFPTGSSLLLSPSPQLHPLPRSSGWQPRPESPQVGTAPPAADEEAWLRGRAEQSPLRPPEPSSTWSAALWGLGGGGSDLHFWSPVCTCFWGVWFQTCRECCGITGQDQACRLSVCPWVQASPNIGTKYPRKALAGEWQKAGAAEGGKWQQEAGCCPSGL